MCCATALNRALSISASSAAAWWLGLAVLSAAVLFLAPPMAEPPIFGIFVDDRQIAGIPHFWNVVSNVPLLVVGVWGVYVVQHANTLAEPVARTAYALCFGAVALAGIGSWWFHLAPDAGRLLWDRLPIAQGFMALLCAVIAERVSMAAGRNALVPLLVAAAASVLYWRWSMLRGTENITPYALVQYGGLAAIVALAMLRSRYTRGGDLLVVAGLYSAAKVAELLDREIYALGNLLSGHTLKHLLAAVAVWWLVRMLQLRQMRAT